MSPRFAWLLPISLAAAGCGHDSCFVAGTRVRTPGGERPIEDLAVGDAIVAWDATARRVVVGRVAAIHRALVRETRAIVAGALRVRGVTRTHPVFELGRGDFVQASELRVGDRLLSLDGEGREGEVAIAAIDAHEVAEPTIPVFNLTVADAPPTYFADGVLVHNKSPVIECTAEQQRAIRIEAAQLQACVGDRFPLRALRRYDWCPSAHDALPAVFATSDPDVLVIEGKGYDPAQAVARGPGQVTITAVHESETASVEITVEDCPTKGE